MAYLKRFSYFILTGILVALTVSFIVSFISQFLGINLAGGGYAGLFVLCLIYGLVGSFVSLQLSRWMAKKFHGVQVIDPQTMNSTERKIVDTVYKLARHAGLPAMPEVGIYNSPDVNAFATGPSKSRSLVAVSTGLLHTMNESEIEGVLAHEIAHIANGDMVTLTLIQGVVNAFAMFFAHILTSIIMSAFRKNNDNERGFGDLMLRHMIYSMVSIVFTILGSIIVNYFSRQREFRADAGGARYANQDKMTAALLKLQKITALPYRHQEEEPQGRDNLATMKISAGNSKKFTRLFMTHPPLEERIIALQNRSYSI